MIIRNLNGSAGAQSTAVTARDLGGAFIARIPLRHRSRRP